MKRPRTKLSRALKARMMALDIKADAFGFPRYQVNYWLRSKRPELGTLRKLSIIAYVPLSVLVNGQSEEILTFRTPPADYYGAITPDLLEGNHYLDNEGTIKETR